jgi:DNA-directed RNA polymerase specialized sigma24 family protein
VGAVTGVTALRPDASLVLSVSTLRSVRESLVEISRRHSRLADEVEDLAHDIIVSALRRGFSLDGERFLRSAHGAARRHGAFLARSAGRRRVREAWSACDDVTRAGVVTDDDVEGAPLSVLSPALRTTLFLLVLGLEKAELRLALGVSDAALRKRFQALREHGPLARPRLPIPRRTAALSQLRRGQVELLPRLAAGLVRGGQSRRVLAASDPDGHGLIFAEALTPGRGTATSDASPTNDGTHTKGSPCSTARSRTSPSSS